VTSGGGFGKLNRNKANLTKKREKGAKDGGVLDTTSDGSAMHALKICHEGGEKGKRGQVVCGAPRGGPKRDKT